MSTSAPTPQSSTTASAFPLTAARCSGVRPDCAQKRVRLYPRSHVHDWHTLTRRPAHVPSTLSKYVPPALIPSRQPKERLSGNKATLRRPPTSLMESQRAARVRTLSVSSTDAPSCSSCRVTATCAFLKVAKWSAVQPSCRKRHHALCKAPVATTSQGHAVLGADSQSVQLLA